MQGGGQIALRFPGDACEKGTCTSSAAHFNAVRKGYALQTSARLLGEAYYCSTPDVLSSWLLCLHRWHIDGCPSDFMKGMTDHYGKIHNFDCLVGVLLNRVDEPMYVRLHFFCSSLHPLCFFFQDALTLLVHRVQCVCVTIPNCS